MSWLSRHRIPLLLFVVGLIGFGAASGARLMRQSSDPHFVLLADAWLSGRLDIDPAKKRGDDWATIETVELADGRTVDGRRLKSRPMFRVAGADEVPLSEVKRSLGKTYYVSFPPFPALLYVPQAAIWGHRANDVPLAVALAALALPLAFLVLRRLADAGASTRTPGQDAWLALALGFGTVLYFAGVQGRVWFTAHVVGVVLSLAYLLCAIEARRPLWAGLFLGLATMTRTPMAFLFPLFALEAWRMYSRSGPRRGDTGEADRASDDKPGPDAALNLAAVARAWALFAAPIIVIAILAMWHNTVRFGEWSAFGHTYLDVRQQARMETTGLFSYDYLSRNLAVVLALLPSFSSEAPYVSISGHGLALWVTSPFFVWLLWPRLERSGSVGDGRTARALWRALWLSVACVALPTLLYQNSGWFQFGYRFSLDYSVCLIALLAIAGPPIGRRFKAVVVLAIAINLFGAITFGQDYRYYRTDARTYQQVIAH
ncbi:MAG: hypothetical protein Tsb0020_31400 [Haliangiales bacterium]